VLGKDASAAAVGLADGLIVARWQRIHGAQQMITGGEAMLILIPWKPVVIVWGLLSAMILFGYIAGSLMKGQNPFAVYSTQTQQFSTGKSDTYAPSQQKHSHKNASGKSL
jgi:hypothetical protein